MNMKNVMVALAAAMLVPALAPTAAASHECDSIVPLLADTNGDYLLTGAVSPLAPIVVLIDKPDATATYTVDRTGTNAQEVRITIWEKPSGGSCGSSAFVSATGTSFTPASASNNYYLFVEALGDEAAFRVVLDK